MYPVIIKALWFILPAYITNSMAINTSGIPLLKRYSTPIDFGKKWKNNRVFGDGKTWRGLISGVLAGTVVGYLQATYQYRFPMFLPQMTMTVSLAFLISLGAIIGDLTASFLKRRVGFKRGAAIPLLDQLDYIFGAFFFAWLAIPIDFPLFIVAAIITIPLHLLSNVFAWSIKLKKVPW